MKFSDRDLKILNHFAQINQNILIEKTPATVKNSNCTSIKTISMMRNILSSALLYDFKVDKDITIHDLNNFLKVYKSLSNPEIVKVYDDYMLIKSDDSFLKYEMCDRHILTLPHRDVNMPDKRNYTFDLTKDEIIHIKKLASKCCLPDVLFESNGETLMCTVLDKKNPKSTRFDFVIDEKTNREKFSAFLKVENLKLFDENYYVTISSKLISRFISDDNVTTYIALEDDCVFEQCFDWKKTQQSDEMIDKKIARLTANFERKRNQLERSRVS